MKVAVVPAQVTTVEDKIAGGLNLTQLVLLVLPVFLFGLIYTLFPPSFELVVYKCVIIAPVILLMGMLAVGIRGTLLLHWFVIIVRYGIRPRRYVYDKNDSTLRVIEFFAEAGDAIDMQPVETKKLLPIPELTTHDQFTMQELMSQPAVGLHFKKNKRGNLHVAINKVES